MRLSSILEPHNSETNFLDIIENECSDFIEESEGLPVFRNLPHDYEDFRKVKVRFKKNSSEPISASFNEAFKNKLPNLRQRAIFTSPLETVLHESIEGFEPFYVFPINGYKYLYNPVVESSGDEYRQAFDLILEQFGNNTDQANKLLTDLLQYTYVSSSLVEGISNNSEIIFYNVPYYYAVRVSAYEYEDLLPY